MLKLHDRARQKFHGLPVVATQSHAEFDLSDEYAQIFRHNESGKEAPGTVDQVADTTSHNSPICNIETDKPPVMQGFDWISVG